jgi:hypothetical protein
MTLAPSLIGLMAPACVRPSPSLIQKTSSVRPSSTKSTPSVPGTCATPDASNVPPVKWVSGAGGCVSLPASSVMATTTAHPSKNMPTTGRSIFTL